MDNKQLVTSIQFLNTSIVYLMAKNLSEEEIDVVVSGTSLRLSTQGMEVATDTLLDYKDSIMNIKREIEVEASKQNRHL